MKNLWITSDSHFFHRNIIKYSKRDSFSSVEEMDEMMIKAWNSCVKPNDRVYHLGDLTLSKDLEQLEKLSKRLFGDKYLIPGNHDIWIQIPHNAPYITQAKEKFKSLEKHWTILPQRYEMNFDKQEYIMQHEPILSWIGAHKGTYMLHGHCHTSVDYLNQHTKRLDCGVDSAYKLLGEYRPFNIDEVKSILDKRDFNSVDHHKGKKDEETDS